MHLFITQLGYKEHPARGAAHLNKLGYFNPTVIQAVLQHHERRDGSGFPQSLGAGSINRVSEIIGISNEFTTLLQQRLNNRNMDVINTMIKNIYPGFSEHIISAFENIFFFPDFPLIVN